MRAINLKTNHLTAPVGIDAGPLFCPGSVLTVCARPPMKLN